MSDHPELFPHQENFLESVQKLGDPARALLFYKTGAGKSLTAMLGMRELGHTYVVVIAPPSTHAQWQELGKQLKMGELDDGSVGGGGAELASDVDKDVFPLVLEGGKPFG